MTEFTTMEKEQMKITSYGAVVKFGEKVIVTDISYKGDFDVEVYEFIDSTDDFDECECRLSKIDEKQGFEDAGHAIQWAVNK